MNIEQLPIGQRKAYELVTQYRKKNPKATQGEALKATGIHGSQFHTARKKLGVEVVPRSRKVKMETLIVPDEVSSQVVAFVGFPKDVVDSLRILMGRTT